MKLVVLDKWNARRKEIAAQYSHLLAGADIVLRYLPDYADPVWHLYVIRSKQRDALKEHLEQQGVSTAIHYPIPSHRQACYQDFRGYNLPIAELLADEVLSLPMSPLLSSDDVNWVVQAIKEYRQ